MHASDSGYSRYQSDWTGPMEMLPFQLDPFRMLTVKERPIFDTMAALTCHGLLTRFPDLQDRRRSRTVATGCRPSSSTSRTSTGRCRRRSTRTRSEAFKRNVYMSPFHEDDLGELVDIMGADHILFGSDYPHPEGLAEPCSYLDHLPAGPTDDVAKIMGGNLGRIMGVGVPVG